MSFWEQPNEGSNLTLRVNCHPEVLRYLPEWLAARAIWSPGGHRAGAGDILAVTAGEGAGGRAQDGPSQ